MKSKEKCKRYVYAHRRFVTDVCKCVSRLPVVNRFQVGKTNTLENSGLLLHCKIAVNGDGNVISVGAFARLKEVQIFISGNNNRITIGDDAYIEKTVICIEDSDGGQTIGKGSIVSRNCHFASMEGTTISIGENCLFSSDITLRTGDSHSILDAGSKRRINPSNDIRIGNHVWVGNNVTILKGSAVGPDSVIGTGSLVTKQFNEGNLVIGGNPAHVLRSGITWDKKRVKV